MVFLWLAHQLVCWLVQLCAFIIQALPSGISYIYYGTRRSTIVVESLSTYILGNDRSLDLSSHHSQYIIYMSIHKILMSGSGATISEAREDRAVSRHERSKQDKTQADFISVV